MPLPVYLDYAATTPVDTRVAEKMAVCLTEDGNFGNPASRSHVYGWRAEEAVENARRDVADLAGCDPREIVWTSGATEANNLAIKGAARFYADKGRHIITSAIEHKAVLDCCAYLETQGYEVTRLKPDVQGKIEPDQLEQALRPDTVLVSLMHVNNEIGVINDIASFGKLTRANNTLLHVDAAQSAGKLPIDLSVLDVDLMSFSAHKVYGPKGAGALYVRRQPKVSLEPLIHGGGHERGMRSGTLATHQCVGMGEAFRLANLELESDFTRLSALRLQLLDGLKVLSGCRVNGHIASVPGIINLCFDGVDGETLLMSLRTLALSSGSACTSATMEPSYVLRAMGLSDEQAQGSLRLSMGRYTTEQDVDAAISALREIVPLLRQTNQKTHVNQSV